MTFSDTSATLITREKLDLMRRELARLRETEEQVKAERLQLQKLVEVAEGFLKLTEKRAAPRSAAQVPAAAEPAAPPAPAAPSVTTRKRGVFANESWTQTIQRVVDAVDGAMTYDELKEEVAKTHLGDRLRESDKSFHGAMLKQERKGQLVRYKGHVFSAKAFAGFKEKLDLGLVDDLQQPKGSGPSSPLKQAVLDMLAERELGATTPAIVDKMLKAPPEVSDSVRRNKTILYNLLSRMAKRGEIVRKGNTYSLPSDRDEPPASPEVGGSKSDGVAAPSIESQQRLRVVG